MGISKTEPMKTYNVFPCVHRGENNFLCVVIRWLHIVLYFTVAVATGHELDVFYAHMRAVTYRTLFIPVLYLMGIITSFGIE